ASRSRSPWRPTVGTATPAPATRPSGVEIWRSMEITHLVTAVISLCGTHTNTRAHTCTHTDTHTNTHACKHTHTDTYTHRHTHTLTLVCAWLGTISPVSCC